MTNETMTMREFFNAVINSDGVAVNVIDKAKSELEKLDKKNANRVSKPSKTQLANEPIKVAILEILGQVPKTAKEIALELSTEENEFTVPKISSLCTQLLKEEKIFSTEVKHKGSNGKNTKCKGYFVE